MDKKIIYDAITSICMPGYYTRMFESMHEGIDETFRNDVEALGFDKFDAIVRNNCEIEGALNDLYGHLNSADSNYFANFVATAVTCRIVRHKTAYIPVDSPIMRITDDLFVGDWVYDTVLTAFKDHDLNEADWDAGYEFDRVVACNEDRFVMRDGKMYREVTYAQICDDYGTELEYNCPAYYVFEGDHVWFELADSTERLDMYDIENKLMELAKNNQYTDMTIHLLCSPYHNADNGKDYVVSEQIIKQSGHAENLLTLIRGYSDYLY